MKLQQLKTRTIALWRELNEVPDDTAARRDIRRQWGDLRRCSTWRAALAALYARKLLGGFCWEGLAQFPRPGHWAWEMRAEILDEILKHPAGLETVRLGLEQLFTISELAPHRLEAAGFLSIAWEYRAMGRLTNCFTQLLLAS